MQITLANPRGFCAGVDRAIEIVERALEIFGAPVYVRHEVVHNKYVVETLRNKGAVFVEGVRKEAARRKLRVYDAICPLVTKVHVDPRPKPRHAKGTTLIGHAGHPEV